MITVCTPLEPRTIAKIADSAMALSRKKPCFFVKIGTRSLGQCWITTHIAATRMIARSAASRSSPAPSAPSAAARCILSGAIEEIPDIEADAEYQHAGGALIIGYRSIVAVPMLKDGQPIGAVAVAKIQTGCFPRRQIELLQTFADQAVIAIENVRLFEEVQARSRELAESLEQQTATANVLKVI